MLHWQPCHADAVSEPRFNATLQCNTWLTLRWHKSSRGGGGRCGGRAGGVPQRVCAIAREGRRGKWLQSSNQAAPGAQGCTHARKAPCICHAQGVPCSMPSAPSAPSMRPPLMMWTTARPPHTARSASRIDAVPPGATRYTSVPCGGCGFLCRVTCRGWLLLPCVITTVWASRTEQEPSRTLVGYQAAHSGRQAAAHRGRRAGQHANGHIVLRVFGCQRGAVEGLQARRADRHSSLSEGAAHVLGCRQSKDHPGCATHGTAPAWRARCCASSGWGSPAALPASCPCQAGCGMRPEP